MSLAVEVEGVTKVFTRAFSQRGIRALDEVALAVAPGEIFGLLGPNGAGKTTLVKILLGLVRPTAGRARLFGQPAPTPAARQRLGYLPENHRFPGFLTAGALLDVYGQLAGVPAAERAARIPSLLEQVRLAPWHDTKIRKFSKGMMQRLGLAQALLNRPALVLLDEPTDGVDPVGRREIRDLLLGLRAEGTTIFLNSHLLSEVEQVCTRVAILHHGQLIREGTIDALTAVERVYEVVCTAIPADVLASLGPAVRPLDGAAEGLQRYEVHAAARPDLNALLDRLRTERVLLEAIRPVRRSLEDYFIDVVQTAPAPESR